MQKTIPTHLASTYQLLQRAFPNGIDEQFYLLLLSILRGGNIRSGSFYEGDRVKIVEN
jgi:hypothetical protein